MTEYNDIWTREKFVEYRKLKRSGYSQDMLIEHFGEDIYFSGLYNRKSTIIPWLEFLTEITITPEYTIYTTSKIASNIYPNKSDYIIRFQNKDVNYIISLFYYILEGIETYNVLLTTEKQWNDYEKKLEEIRHKGYITDEERNELVNIVEKETNLHQIWGIMKRISYILFDFFKNNTSCNNILSIGETKNPVKINLYRNIIKNSFRNIKELGEKFDDVGNKYFIYKIEENLS
jgi:hypothetical protein